MLDSDFVYQLMSLEELFKKKEKPHTATSESGDKPDGLLGHDLITNTWRLNSHQRLLNCVLFKLKSCVQLSNRSVI